MKILVGCEESQAVCIALREQGHEAYSCDLKPCSGGHPEWHLQLDVFTAIAAGELRTQAGDTVFIAGWDVGIFFPDCTYLAISAEWAYKDQPALKSGKLVGAARREARERALRFVCRLMNCRIPRISIENPIGVIGSRVFRYVGGENGLPRWEVFPRKLDNGGRKPDQIIQPYQFGDDASKSTCLWLKNLPELTPTGYYPPRIVNGKKRWGNQTDSGQNRLPPSETRAELRSKTFPGIAAAMASQWGGINNEMPDWF
jgi:hypothetical protein